MAQGRRTSFITAVKRDGLEAGKCTSFITAVETDDYEGRGEQGIREARTFLTSVRSAG